jgi:hypothetical protein
MTSEKLCGSCKEVKSANAFGVECSRKDGLSSWCKPCKNMYNVSAKGRASKDAWRLSPEGVEYHKTYETAYMSDPLNHARKMSKQKNNRNQNPHRKRIDKEYTFKYTRREETKARKNEKRRQLRRTSVEYRMMERLRGRIKDVLKHRRPFSVSKSLGCTPVQLRTYLEDKFQPGMTWANWGLYGWHIDHIKPLASFDLTDPKQYQAAVHHTNLQPLWALDNLRKRDRNE